MAGKRNIRSKRPIRSNRRKRTGRKRVRISHRISSAASRPAAVTRYSALRSFMLYPKASANDPNKIAADSWLDKLYKYGLMALKIFSFVLAQPSPMMGKDWTFAITSVCQGFYIGIDDFILNSPISETVQRFGKKYVAKFDYKQGRVTSFTITVTPGSELSRRAGEYVVAVVLLSIEQSTMVVSNQTPPDEHHVVFLPESISFEEAMQYPSAVVCPADKPTQLTVVTTGNAAEWHRIGHYIETADTPKFPGGPPIAKLVFGYRDMSSSKPDAENLYSADESMIQVDMTSKMCFREPGACFIRTTPLRSMNDTLFTACMPDGSTYLIPLDQIKRQGALLYVPDDIMKAAMEKDSISKEFEMLEC